ncbi:MAG: GNAT family N-acetyltransferase [Gammaproteobacteria bacterium]|nr:GNAT family N-acetyltransferase [Gammaproteobacteria bacterium]
MKRVNWKVTPIAQCSDQLWQQWQTLYQQFHSHNPMLDPRFVSTLVKYYPGDIDVVIGHVDSELVAILLLQKTGFGCWKNYMPSQSQIAFLLLAPEVDFNSAGLISALGGQAIKLDLLSLDPQEHHGAINNISQLQHHAKNIKLVLENDFETYWRSRSKRLRKDMAQSFNRLVKSNINLSNKVTTELHEIAAAVDRYGMLESQGWKGRNGTAIHPANTQGQFYGALLELFSHNQQALVFESYIDDNLVASRLCIFNQQTLIILKTTFDEQYSRYSLGNVNRYKLIEYLFIEKVSKYIDFYTNASKEQLYWSTEQRSMYNGSCYRFPVVERGIGLIKKLKKSDGVTRK